MDQSPIPSIIREVGFDFSWDVTKVWQLDVPVSDMQLAELVWHFDIPFLWYDGGVYNLTPRQVMTEPDRYKDEFLRMLESDPGYPIDIMRNKGRWLILDGLHRLMRLSREGKDTVRVRKIPRSKIPAIQKNG